ncbi:MAG: AIR carboxylase family protein [Chloroflexi bacterium]|nr:AIR carboxylase family protein [Chloroflexota bacterium]
MNQPTGAEPTDPTTALPLVGIAMGSASDLPTLRGAAHLPGMLAAHTPLPVIGVPVSTTTLSGLDALLSIVQMPRGVPVATVAIGGGANAGLLAVQILATSDGALLERLLDYKAELAATARRQDADVTAGP